MGKTKMEAYRCDVCGYLWPVDVRKPIPAQCRNPECRSRKWNAGGKGELVEQPAPKRPVASSSSVSSTRCPRDKSHSGFQRPDGFWCVDCRKLY